MGREIRTRALHSNRYVRKCRRHSHDIHPGKPTQTSHVESFHGGPRDECLNAIWFHTLNDVRFTLAEI
jgi:hypothetical protein